MVKVLFVCMGNICRSPTAQGVFEKLLREEGLDDRVRVDSAGTHAYHVGEPPDPRAQLAAANRDVDLAMQRARQVSVDDFAEFDYVLAMDQDNLSNLAYLCPKQHRAKLALFLDFAEGLRRRDVPDPYYGGDRGFEKVLNLVQAASEGLLRDIRERHL
jgi:protein-tyrosine phosphatase